LRRLVDFRLLKEDEDDTGTRPYSRARTVRWELSIDTTRQSARMVDLADSSQSTTRFGRPVLVPNSGRTSGIGPSLGADDAQYVLGWCDDKSKPDRVSAAHAAFVDLCRRWLHECPDDPSARALVAFYDRGELPTPPDGVKWASKELMVVAVDG